MALTLPHATHHPLAWRLRVAVVLDLCAGTAMIPLLCFAGYALPPVWADAWFPLLPNVAVVMLSGLALALLGWLARRGQTLGLAAVRLRWLDAQGRASKQRLVGEPQYWCVVLPALWVACTTPVGTAQLFVRCERVLATLDDIGTAISVLLVVGGLAVMMVSRRRQGQLVPTADVIGTTASSLSK